MRKNYGTLKLDRVIKAKLLQFKHRVQQKIEWRCNDQNVNQFQDNINPKFKCRQTNQSYQLMT